MDRMDDLIAFLRARLDEDAATARSGDEWTVNNQRNLVAGPTRDEKAKYHLVAVVVEDTERTHIARHDPARVLAEVDAKRRVLDEFVTSLNEKDKEHDETFGLQNWDFDPTALPLLQLLVLPYADHPDYRPEWAPTPR